MRNGTDPKIDIALAVFLIVVCAIVLFETRTLPPGTFEPLGSAPIPQATAALIILLCLVVIARAFGSLRAAAARAAGEDEGGGGDLRPLDAVAIFALTVLYVAVMQARLTDFAIMTAIYLVLAIGFLCRFKPRLLPWIVVIALIVGYGSQYLFTRVFIVDLPGL